MVHPVHPGKRFSLRNSEGNLSHICTSIAQSVDVRTTSLRKSGRVAAVDRERGDGSVSYVYGRRGSRRVLTDFQAFTIYQLRASGTAGGEDSDSEDSSAGSSVRVAARYGVSPKTVRDIWNRETFVEVTNSCWTEEERADYTQKQIRIHQEQGNTVPMQQIRGAKFPLFRAAKRRGRPPGSKDKNPRKKRADGEGEDERDTESPTTPMSNCEADISEQHTHDGRHHQYSDHGSLPMHSSSSNSTYFTRQNSSAMRSAAACASSNAPSSDQTSWLLYATASEAAANCAISSADAGHSMHDGGDEMCNNDSLSAHTTENMCSSTETDMEPEPDGCCSPVFGLHASHDGITLHFDHERSCCSPGVFLEDEPRGGELEETQDVTPMDVPKECERGAEHDDDDMELLPVHGLVDLATFFP